jgi:hypothetical protein
MGKVTIEGKRFSKIRKEVISPSEFGTVFKAGKNGISVFERLDKFIEFGSKMMEQEPKSDEQDSYYNLGQRLHLQALIARNEKNTIEGRLEAAIELGIIYQVIMTYEIESQTNKNNAANSKVCLPLENFVIDLLDKKKKYREIWDALPKEDEADDFYKRNDVLYSKNRRGFNLADVSKDQFIDKKIGVIRKKYKNTPL